MPKPNRSFNFLDKINADAQKQEQKQQQIHSRENSG